MGLFFWNVQGNGLALMVLLEISPALSGFLLHRCLGHMAAKVSVSLIREHWSLLTELMELMPTLSFKGEDLRNSMSAVRAERSPDWPLQLRPQEEAEWDQTMKKRLQIMMRHVAQARLARRSWFVALTSAQDLTLDELDGETAIVDVAAAKASQHVWVGYDAWSRKAWRQVDGEPRQHSTDWLLEDADKPTDVARVRFADTGDIKEIEAGREANSRRMFLLDRKEC